MKVHGYTLQSYVRREYGLTEEEFFNSIQDEKRNAILNCLFVRFANHRLYRDGLTHLQDRKNRFDNYQSFEHLDKTNFRIVARDIEITKKKSKNRLERFKRKIHIARKERFEARKRQNLRNISDNLYLLKWSPKNKETKRRLESLKSVKEKEKSRDFER